MFKLSFVTKAMRLILSELVRRCPNLTKDREKRRIHGSIYTWGRIRSENSKYVLWRIQSQGQLEETYAAD